VSTQFTIFYCDEKGGGLIEYGLIVALIAVAAAAAISATGIKIGSSLGGIADVLENLQTNRSP